MSELRFEELSAATIVAVNALTLKPGQEQYIVPVSYGAAAAVSNPATAWQRVVLEGDSVVGFIHGNFDAENHQEEFRCCLWRINVDADAQGKGVGKFALAGLAAEARARNFDRLTVLWERGDDGPEEFFLRVGFTPIGETTYGEVIGALDLNSAHAH
ncbi:GNAT family N-acetyltransferase [Klugiella xanthotipulae]|uniref:Diamine N-acetyltransferase n=1 Tax=Klugiella xanthotipulae TaxID=244735 RepID=A0A543I530_9MICO|nr:GNAT family N-acetyltransferase [Klugiella xanthotipulae]TQM65695.1 diamine N-acetyltransferase [Klugiella xanthotipulae]